MKKLEFTIDIQSPPKEVWEKMLNKDTYLEWTGVSWPGSDYKGKWEKGEKIRFASEDGSGTLAEIKELEPYKKMHADHIAVLEKGGIEDTKSDIAKRWIGTQEVYFFAPKGNATNLKVELLVYPEWEKMFTDGWPNALKKLKEICERKN